MVSQLKKFLEVSTCNLSTICKAFDQMISLQHMEIKRSFGESSIKVTTGYRGSLYTELLVNISVAALEIIKREEEFQKSGQPSSTICTHMIRRTLGLPCSH